MQKSPKPNSGAAMADILAAIRDERRRKELTYAAAAESVGLKASNWCAIETGNRPASDELLKRMAASLGLQLTLELRATIIRVDDVLQSGPTSDTPAKPKKRSTAAAAKPNRRKRAAKSA